MAYQSNLLGDIYRRQNQRRALTGLPSSYQESRGLFDAALEYDAKKAYQAGLLGMQKTQQDRDFALREEAQKDANTAALVGGIGQIAQLPIAYGSAKSLGLLGSSAAPVASAPSVTAQGAVAPATAGMTAQTAALSGGPPLLGAAPYSGAGPSLSYGAGGSVGSGLGSGAAITGATPAASTGMGLLGTAGAVGATAGLFAGQYYTGKASKEWMDEHGFKYTNRGWTYGGTMGATTGFVVDVGKKVYEEAKDFISKIF